MKRVAAICGIFAAFGLLATPASSAVLQVPSCHGGLIDLPIKQDGKPVHDKNCAFGCHAPLCQSRKRRSASA